MPAPDRYVIRRGFFYIFLHFASVCLHMQIIRKRIDIPTAQVYDIARPVREAIAASDPRRKVLGYIGS